MNATIRFVQPGMVGLRGFMLPPFGYLFRDFKTTDI